MPVIQRAVVVAANSTNENVLAGSQYEFARRRCLVSIGIMQSAAGLRANINSGGDVVAEVFEPQVAARFPIIPDEMYYNDVMEAGDRLSIPVQNTTAGNLTAFTIVQIQDL